MHGPRNWKEIASSVEAQELRSAAESQYKARRRQEAGLPPSQTHIGNQQSAQVMYMGRPPTETLWWDSNLCTSLPTNRPHEDAPLIMLFLDFIFPIQFGFYPMSTPTDHSWLISGLCSNKARYQAALSVSACFDTSLREPQKVDGIGLSLAVTDRQTEASSGLQDIIARFDQQNLTPKEMILVGIQILEVMHQLLSLEIFSMLEGAWELHHQATRTLLDTLHTYRCPSTDETTTIHESPLETALKDFSSPDTQRTLEFHVTCVVWVDIIANATYGLPPTPRSFDYIPYLQTNTLKTQQIMGCRSSVMAIIAEIKVLADWRVSQLETDSLDDRELSERAESIATRLVEQIKELEEQSTLNMTKLGSESRLVTLLFACAAQVYLRVVSLGPNTSDPEMIIHVEKGLQMMEAFPQGLVIRVNLAFVMLGCMATNEQYDRFRGLISRLAARNQPLGMTWKGLMVMEECWRLRESQLELEFECDWKSAMKSLGKRMLLV